MMPQDMEPYMLFLTVGGTGSPLLGHRYGYHSNDCKTWLTVKEGLQDAASSTFAGTSVQVTTQGKRHLEAVLGTQYSVEHYVTKRVKEWISELEQLSNIACSQPHIVYCCAYIHWLEKKIALLSKVEHTL